MKIIILGGYGVFGGRLCQLLASEPRLSLFIAGRSLESATALCNLLPAGAKREALQFERDQNLDEQIRRACPDLVIDASGPFQSYGEDPYRVVKACLANNVNYMDFADGADFVKGISQYNQMAKDRNVFVLSGVSSFPILTAAVVRRLALNLDKIISIKGGIAPSPFAGVGKNVIRAIAAYAGQKVKLVRGGRLTFAHALTEITRYTISPPGRLPLDNVRFSLVDVPDLQVLPELWPELDAIWMGAGPVPEILHRMLNGLSWLVRLRILRSLSPLAPVFFHAINILRWGEHRGGMFVEIEGLLRDGSRTTRSWHLLAEGNDGPYIPCMALEAMIHRMLSGCEPKPGARPASMELELDDYERLFSQRTIFTGEREYSEGKPASSIFHTLLGAAWSTLPDAIRNVHDKDEERLMSGTATVERGDGVFARLIASLFKFPVQGRDIPVLVQFKSSGHSETWKRTFAGRSFLSTLFLGQDRLDKLLCERFGAFTFGLALVIDQGKLKYIVRQWKIWRIPLPRAWAPGGNSYEFESDGRFCFHIEIGHPLTGLIVRYSGWLRTETGATPK